MASFTLLAGAAAALLAGGQPPGGASSPPPGEGAPAEEPLEHARATEPAGPDLRLELTPWIWAMSIDGDLTIGERTAAVDADFVEVLENSDSLIGLAGRLELWYGRVGAFVDGAYARIGVDDIPTQRGTVDVETEIAIVDFAVQYRLVQAPGGAEGSGRGLTLDLYAGGAVHGRRAHDRPGQRRPREAGRGMGGPDCGCGARAAARGAVAAPRERGCGGLRGGVRLCVVGDGADRV